MRVELRDEAREDLVEGAAFYAEQSPGLDDRFLESVRADLNRLEANAGIHEVYQGFHRALSLRFPFAIYYLIGSEMKQMSRRRTFLRIVLLIAILGGGGLVGRETVEVGDGTGSWSRVISRFAWAWEPTVAASMRPENDQHPAVRVTRWYCYGLAFNHSEHHSAD